MVSTRFQRHSFPCIVIDSVGSKYRNTPGLPPHNVGIPLCGVAIHRCAQLTIQDDPFLHRPLSAAGNKIILRTSLSDYPTYPPTGVQAMEMEYNGVVPPINMNDPYNKLTAPPSSRVPLTGDFSPSQSQRQSVLAQAFFAKIAEAGRRTEVALDQLVAIQGTPTPSIDLVRTALSIGTNNDLKTRDKAAIVSRKLFERMLPFSADTETSIIALLRNASTAHLTAAALAQSPNLLSSHSIAFLVAARVKEILSGDLHDKVSAPLLLSSLDSFASYPSALGPLVELLLASTDNLRTQRGLELSLKLGPQSGTRPSRLYWIAMSPQRNDELRTNACLALARFGEDGKPFLSRISHYGDSLVKEVAKSSLRTDDIPVLVELKTLLSLTGEWTRALVNKLWSFIRD